MCGIAASVGHGDGVSFVTQALKRLEYRGYDSWGYACMEGAKLTERLRCLGAPYHVPSTSDKPVVVIGHTRWATHGKPSKANCHPIKCNNTFVVHNGVIYNHRKYREMFHDYEFTSDTDTEVIAKLFDSLCKEAKTFQAVMCDMISHLIGTYAFAIASGHFPGKLIICANGSPLVFTLNGRVASDAMALAGESSPAYRLSDGHFAILDGSTVKVFDHRGWEISLGTLNTITIPGLDDASIGEWNHFMQKEIFEQKETVKKKRRFVGSLPQTPTQVTILGCGSSYNAALLVRESFEKLANVQTNIEYASEFVHRTPFLYPKGTVFVIVTQSGETKDVLHAMEHLAKFGFKQNMFLITNREASTALSICPNGILLDVGLEVGVAATKTFTSTVLALLELASLWSNNPAKNLERFIDGEMYSAVEDVFSPKSLEQIQFFADKLCLYDKILFLGRGRNYGIAREGALKMKEVSYIHAEAMPSAEMKHGPLALIDEDVASVFVVTSDDIGNESVSANIEEVITRGGYAIAIVEEGAQQYAERLPLLTVKNVSAPWLRSIAATIALQLIAYYVAVKRGRSVDRPRNLAKTVTVH